MTDTGTGLENVDSGWSVMVLVLVEVVGSTDSTEVLVLVLGGGGNAVTGFELDKEECGVVEGSGWEVEGVLVLVVVVVGAAVVLFIVVGDLGSEGVGEVVAPLIGDLVGVEGAADIVVGTWGGFGVTLGVTVLDCDELRVDCTADIDRERVLECAKVVAPGMVVSEIELSVLADTETVLETDVWDPVAELLLIVHRE
jgi:hypothetical protein